MNKLFEIIETASRQLGYADHTPVGYTEPTARIRKMAATNGALSLRAALPEIKGTPSRPSVAATLRPAGEALTLADAVMANSRVLRAGAHLIALPEPRLIETGAAPALAETPAGLRVLEPASFAAITLDGITGEGEVTASALADIIATADLDRSAMTQHAFRVNLPRSAQKDIGAEQLTAETMHAIALGLGRAIDRQLIGTLVAAATAAFVPGAAAAKGLHLEELAGIIGTTGTGATLDQGHLYAAGIPAQLSADLAGTLVAAWSRFAVVAAPSVDILAERTDAAGGMTITAWIDLASLAPDTGFAFAVA